MLKRELGAERAWQEFSTQATQTIARVQQTALAALAPPRQRRKARYMNVAELVGWGGRIVQYLDEDGQPAAGVGPATGGAGGGLGAAVPAGAGAMAAIG